MLSDGEAFHVRPCSCTYDFILLFYDVWYKQFRISGETLHIHNISTLNVYTTLNVSAQSKHTHTHAHTYADIVPVSPNHLQWINKRFRRLLDVNSLALTSTWNLFIGMVFAPWFLLYKTNTKDAFIHRIFTFIVMVAAKIIANISTLIDEAHTISINPLSMALRTLLLDDGWCNSFPSHRIRTISSTIVFRAKTSCELLSGKCLLV